MAALLGMFVGLVLGLVPTLVICYLRTRELARTVAERPLVQPETYAVLDVLRSAAIVVGPHDEILHSTAPARTTGLVRGTRIGVGALLDMVRSVRLRGQPSGLDMRLSQGPGTPPRELTVRVAPLGKQVVLVVADDRSAEVRVESTKRDLVANVSHELKTPVGALRVLAEAIEQAADDPQAVRHFAGRMNQEAERLGDLVGQIITLSRLQSDDPMLGAQVIDLNDVVGEVVANARVVSEARHINLSAALGERVEVVGDRGQLVSAVLNLVQNGIAYSNERGRVSVSTRRVLDQDDEFVEVVVADNGIGIKPEDLDRVFERFYRADYARSRESGGTGLGLSIVKHIAAAHGGTVDVWSKVGQGSTFTIRLPAAMEAPAGPASGSPNVRTASRSEVAPLQGAGRPA